LRFEALRGDRTIQEIAAKHRLHPTQVSMWKRQEPQGPSESELKDLHAKIGRLAVENDFLAQGLKYYRQAIACNR